MASILHPLSAESLSPSAYYRELQFRFDGADFVYDETAAAYIVSGYGLAAAVLKSDAFGKPPIRLPLDGTPSGFLPALREAERLMNLHLGSGGGEALADRRKAWARRLAGMEDAAFSASARKAFEGARGRKIDLMDDLFRPYVLRTILGHLGIEDLPDRCVAALIDYVGFLDGRPPSPSSRDGPIAFLELLRDLTPILLARREDIPGGSTLSSMQWVVDAAFVLAAAQESTAFLLGTICLAVEEAGTCVLPGPEDAAALIDEALRYDPPVQLVGRMALRATRIGSLEVREGDRVYCHLGLVHRDPRIFPDPDRFDPARIQPPTLAFGLGSSHCIGATYARRQARAMLDVLTEISGTIQILRQDVTYHASTAAREFSRLPARVGT